MQKKKAEGPLLPEQPTKKLKSSDDHTLFQFKTDTAEEVKEKIDTQGAKIRSLKTSGASKVGHMTPHYLIMI